MKIAGIKDRIDNVGKPWVGKTEHMKQDTGQLKKIEEIKDRCLKLTGGKINEDFWGYVFGSLMDYGNAHGGLMSHKAFMEAIEIAKTTPHLISSDEIKREAIKGYLSYIGYRRMKGLPIDDDADKSIEDYLTQSKEGGE